MLWLALVFTAVETNAMKQAENATIQALIVFGDSIMDTGNNNNLPTLLKSNFSPYGKQFPGGLATGRFSDGRIPSDLIAEKLGLTKTLPAYLNPNLKPEDLLKGVTFASGGTGYDPLTSKLMKTVSAKVFTESKMAERGGERGAERGGDRGGFGRGFGGRGGGRGGPRGRGGRRGGRATEEEKWTPVTKLGRLVRENKITKLEQIYLHSLPVKEYQIIDLLVGPTLKDEVMKIMPVQKQTRAGQRTRFKAFVVVGDGNGHVGLGVKCSKEVATAIRGGIILAKLSVIPVRRGYWGNKIGKPHTVPCKVTGKCGSVTVRMVPAPRGAGIVAARVPKKVLQFAGIDDVFTSSRGSTKTLGNFVKATFDCLQKTYGFLTPEFWKETRFSKSPYQEYTDLLASKQVAAPKAIADAEENAA
ncbi:unnamed protein product [Microthlaspi erraticum]|uniref:Small ribosomal subunit protein uS5 n=1 Tax=Microthlaspi erraticum TaxID=1685480 RepID=A0A6D2I7F5_9BRAS|nr:unnamed protein product [Microthlaspi erraticum]